MADATSTRVQVYRDGRHIGYCTARRAHSRVRSHRARWRNQSSIEMQPQDPRDSAERERIVATRIGYAMAACAGVASLQQLHHVPVSNARRLLGMGKNTGAYARLN